LRTVSGTAGFLAPELLGFIDLDSRSNFSYTTAVDIWAVGEINFRMLSGGEAVFQNLNELRRYVEGRLNFPSDELCTHGVSQEAYSFTKNLMAAIPDNRPSAEKALEFGWFKSQRDSSEHNLDNGLLHQTDTMIDSKARTTQTRPETEIDEPTSLPASSINPTSPFSRQWKLGPGMRGWTSVHQDKESELPDDQRRLPTAQLISTTDGLVANPVMESPEWWVSKILHDSITTPQLQNLSIRLLRDPLFFCKTFVEIQGLVALTNILIKINQQRVSMPELARLSASGENGSDREYLVVRCLLHLMNSKHASDQVLKHQQILSTLATCLTSPDLGTRELVNYALGHACDLEKGVGCFKVLQAMDLDHDTINGKRRSDAWMRIIEVTIDTRGHMDSSASKSQEFGGDDDLETRLMNYIGSTLGLINTIVRPPESYMHMRQHIHHQLITSGIKKILPKTECFQNRDINGQVEKLQAVVGRPKTLADFEGLVVSPYGWIEDKTGKPVGRICHILVGDRKKITRGAVKKDDVIIDKQGNVVARAECFKETEAEPEPIQEIPIPDFKTSGFRCLTLNRRGYGVVIVNEGDCGFGPLTERRPIVRLVEGNLKELVGRGINEYGQIRSYGKVVGRCERLSDEAVSAYWEWRFGKGRH
jgi:hypothetical protein